MVEAYENVLKTGGEIVLVFFIVTNMKSLVISFICLSTFDASVAH